MSSKEDQLRFLGKVRQAIQSVYEVAVEESDDNARRDFRAAYGDTHDELVAYAREYCKKGGREYPDELDEILSALNSLHSRVRAVVSKPKTVANEIEETRKAIETAIEAMPLEDTRSHTVSPASESDVVGPITSSQGSTVGIETDGEAETGNPRFRDLVAIPIKNVWIARDNENAEAFDRLDEALDTLYEYIRSNAHPSERDELLAALMCLRAMVNHGGVWSGPAVYAGDILEKALMDAALSAIRPTFNSSVGWIAALILAVAKGSGS